MSLSFSIPDTSPFIHYDPLTRWTAAYAPLDGASGGGDQTYHQAGVANAGVDFNLTASAFNVRTGASPFVTGPSATDCGLSISINGSAPSSTCSMKDLPDGAHRVRITAQQEGTRIMGVDGQVKQQGSGEALERVIDNKASEWRFEGPWTHVDTSTGGTGGRYGDLSRYEGQGVSASNGTARAQLDFTGEAIWVYGYAGPYGGAARVWLDGREMANLNTSLPWASVGALMFFMGGLDGKATHTLTFDALGRGEVVLDGAVVALSTQESWIQSNLAAVLGGISGLIAFLLLLALTVYVILLRRGRQMRERQGWTRMPGTGFLSASYLPPGQAHSVEQWRRTSLRSGYGGEEQLEIMYDKYDHSASMNSANSMTRLKGAGAGAGAGYTDGPSPSPSRSVSSRLRGMRELPHTASTTSSHHAHALPLSASTIRSPPVAYRTPGMGMGVGVPGSASTLGPDGFHGLGVSTSTLHVNRPPASPGYLPYSGPIEPTPYSLGYAFTNSASRLPGVVGGSAAARAWLERASSRRSKASTARSGAASRAGTAKSAGQSSSTKSDVSGVLGIGRRMSRETSISGMSLLSAQPQDSKGSKGLFGPARGLDAIASPEDAYRQPGRNRQWGGGGARYGYDREELEDERERERYSSKEEVKRRKMAEWVRGVEAGSGPSPLPKTPGSASASSEGGRERDVRGIGRSQRGSNGAPLSSVSGFSSELGEPFTAMIGTASPNPLSSSSRVNVSSAGLGSAGVMGTGRADDDRMERTIDEHPSALTLDTTKVGARGAPRVPLSISSRTLSLAMPSSRIIPSSGGITPLSSGPSHTPLARGQEIALTPVSELKHNEGGDGGYDDNDDDEGVARQTGVRRRASMRSAKTDRSYLSFLRGPDDGPWNANPHANGAGRSISGREAGAGVTGHDGLPPMPHTAARPDSAIFPPFGRDRKECVDADERRAEMKRVQSVSRSEYERERGAVGRHTPSDDDEGEDDGSRSAAGAVRGGLQVQKHKKGPPQSLGLHGASDPGFDTGAAGASLTAPRGGAGDSRASVPVSEAEGMRNWVIELDPISPTTTVSRSVVSRPHSYTRGW